MVGSGTQQADDPQLAVRDAEVTRQPLRIVVDSNARTPASARVLDDAAPTLIAVADDADASHLEGRAEVVRLPRVAAGLDLELLLKALRERGGTSDPARGWPDPGRLLPGRRTDRPGGGLHRADPDRRRRQAGIGRAGRAQHRGCQRFRLEDVVRIGPDVRLTQRRCVDGPRSLLRRSNGARCQH